jgi:hypothetical protein
MRLTLPGSRIDLGLAALLAVFATGWIFAISLAAADGGLPATARGLTLSPLAPGAPPAAPFALDAALRYFSETAQWRGESGEVRVVVPEPGTGIARPEALPGDVDVGFRPADEPAAAPAAAPTAPGIWNILVQTRGALRAVPDLLVLAPVAAGEVRGGRMGRYMIGEWPARPAGRSPAYDPPRGLIRVTPENVNLPVSRHFVLGDFLTKGQDDVWPKYLVLSPRLLDKLELTIQELEAVGVTVTNVGVVSGFRTPHYNMRGGDPRGRGALSRHMYGDAADIFIDNDRNGQMDDLNGDGRVDLSDARMIAEAAERVERRFPHLIGGIGVYRPRPGAHSGFVHIDTRGYRARW